MRALSILSLLVVVYVCFAIVAYMAVKTGVGSFFWFVGIGMFAVLFGALAATVSTTIKIFLREKRHMEIREMMWHKGKGRD